MSDYVKKIHPRTRSMNLKLSPFLKEKPIETQTPNFCQFHPVLEFLGQRGTFSETSLVSTKKNPPFPVSENHPHLQLRPSTGDAQKMPGVLGIPVMKNTGIPRRFTPNLTIFFNVGKTIPEKKKKTSQPTLTMIGKFSANSMMKMRAVPVSRFSISSHLLFRVFQGHLE